MTTKKTTPETDLAQPTQAAAEPALLPAVGCAVRVLPGAGCTLINNETGTLFSAAEPTAVTVTTTIQRRLLDGDLVLAA